VKRREKDRALIAKAGSEWDYNVSDDGREFDVYHIVAGTGVDVYQAAARELNHISREVRGQSRKQKER